MTINKNSSNKVDNFLIDFITNVKQCIIREASVLLRRYNLCLPINIVNYIEPTIP